MKRIPLALAVFAAFLSIAGCDSGDEKKETGVCYCEFFRGEDQQYDLRSLSRADQVTECRRHDTNAANFGGDCRLK